MKKVDKSMVGQTVYLKSDGNNARYGVKIKECKITKVGRKYYEVGEENSKYFNVKFKIEGNDQVTEYSADWKLYFSQQEILDEEEYNATMSLLRSKFDRWGVKEFTLDQLRRIKAIIVE